MLNNVGLANIELAVCMMLTESYTLKDISESTFMIPDDIINITLDDLELPYHKYIRMPLYIGKHSFVKLNDCGNPIVNDRFNLRLLKRHYNIL